MKNFFKSIFISLSIISLGCTADGLSSGEFPQDFNTYVNKEGLKSGKTFLSIYLVEDNKSKTFENISNDLKEIYEGFNNLDEDNRSNIEISMAFGQYDNLNSNGIKYTDINCLSLDLEDKIIGNDSCYTKELSNSSINEKKSLEEFILYSSEKAKNYDKSIFIIINNQSTNIYKNDEKNLSIMSLKEAFKKANFKWDIIGLDQSFMSNIEVAKALKDSSNYLISSQGYEPSHGWNYSDIVNLLATKKEDTVIDNGTKIVDSFISNQNHKESNFKSLSLIDLSLIDSIEKNISELSSLIKTDINYSYPSINKYLYKNSSFNNKLVNNIDLIGFIDLIKQGNLFTYDIKSELFNKLVVYHKSDNNNKKLNGINILSLNNFNLISTNNYSEDIFISNEWLNLTNDFYNISSSDNSPPLYANERNCNINGENRTCFEAGDNTGINKISLVKAQSLLNNKYTILFTEEIEDLGNNQFSFSNIDNNLITICDTNCQKSLIIPTEFDSKLNNGNNLYTSQCIINGENSTLLLEINSNKIVAYSIINTKKDSNNNISTYKINNKLKKGDSLSFIYKTIDLNNKEVFMEEGEKIIFNDTPYFDTEITQNKVYYFSLIEDIKGNFETTSILKD